MGSKRIWEALRVTQLVKKVSFFHRNEKFITVFKSTYQPYETYEAH